MHGDSDGIVFHRHSVSVVERGEGYRELRCIPATWSYSASRPLLQLLAEFYSIRVGDDPYGTGLESQFWSGSDTALRLRAVAMDDLALRELTALATRRSVGINAPKPRAAVRELASTAAAWEPEATGIHFSQVVERRRETDLWQRYGMTKVVAAPVIVGYGMRGSHRQALGRTGSPWFGARGVWYDCSTLQRWRTYPRRQDVQQLARSADYGKLLLFISHRWDSLVHPDPTGKQLLAFKVGLTLSMAAAALRAAGDEPREATESGLAELLEEYFGTFRVNTEAVRDWAGAIRAAARSHRSEREFWKDARRLEADAVRDSLRRIRERILIWYDYASMFQEPRTQPEQLEFQREILDLNEIQAGAATLVIAGDSLYLTRAWCFLELCGGMRQRIVELTPSWGEPTGVGMSVTRWASQSDQLIGAFNVLGESAISHSGLDATLRQDLSSVAALIRQLPLTAVVEADDSDLIGGSVPVPRRSGEWLLPRPAYELGPTRTRMLEPLTHHGRPISGVDLADATSLLTSADALGGELGIWVYATNKMLALAWLARAREITQWVAAHDQEREFAAAVSASPGDTTVSVACLWADACGLVDDGAGWTRAIPSTVKHLLIVTQVDLPDVCRIYDWVVRAHLAAGVVVTTYAPETGRTLVYTPEHGRDSADRRRLDVLAVPRVRRPDVVPGRMFVDPDTRIEDMHILAALRLDPREGRVVPGRRIPEAAQFGFGSAGDEITTAELLSYSQLRVRTEALARAAAASWDEWCTARVHSSAWAVGMAPVQLTLIEQLVRKSFAVSDNPLERRKLLNILIADHAGYALPPSIVSDADVLIGMIANEREGSS